MCSREMILGPNIQSESGLEPNRRVRHRMLRVLERQFILKTGAKRSLPFFFIMLLTYGCTGNIVIETADPEDFSGSFNSLALDNEGSPHIAYHNLIKHSLKHAWHDGTQWRQETVDAAGLVGLHTSIAMDPSNFPRISYYDQENGDLKYASLSDSGWLVEVVDSTGDVGQYTSLKITPDGYAVISYFDWDNGDLKVARKSGPDWAIETIDSAGIVGMFSSLGIGPLGTARVAYYDATNRDLKYASEGLSGWIVETVDSGGSVGFDPSLALSSSGLPRIAYFDSSSGGLKYAIHNGTGWVMENVSLGLLEAAGYYVYLALDSEDRPWIAVLSGLPVNILYGTRDNGSWHFEFIRNYIDAAGPYAGIAILPSGGAKISFYDLVNIDLRCATIPSIPAIGSQNR